MPLSPLHIQQQEALKTIKADLKPYADNKIIGEIISALENPQLTWTEGTDADKKFINVAARNKLLNFIKHEKQTEANQNLFLAIFNTLMILATYWPLNDYKKNATKSGFSYICPISLEELNADNTFILPSGTLIDKAMTPQFLINCANNNSFKDPVTGLEFKNGAQAFFKAPDHKQGRQIFSHPTYQREKNLKIRKAAVEGLEDGLAGGMITALVVFVFLHAIIPVLLIPVLFFGALVIGGTIGAIKTARKTSTMLKAEEAQTLEANPLEQQQQKDFAKSMQKIKTQAVTQYQNSTNEMCQKLGELKIQTQSQAVVPIYQKSHAWKNAPAQLTRPLLTETRMKSLTARPT